MAKCSRKTESGERETCAERGKNNPLEKVLRQTLVGWIQNSFQDKKQEMVTQARRSLGGGVLETERASQGNSAVVC